MQSVSGADGTRIVFTSTRDGSREIYVMDADGGNQTRLTDHPAGDYRPDWSPDALYEYSVQTGSATARPWLSISSGPDGRSSDSCPAR
jgi:Tol biopolymer transport system component